MAARPAPGAGGPKPGCYNPRVLLATMAAALVLALTVPGPGTPFPQTSEGLPIRTEFRVFDGTVEVTAETRLRVRPSGSSEAGRILEGPTLTVELPPGIYDVQAVRQRSGQVVNVRWAERLVIMPYPDEAGRHLEVINFTNQYGALQLRWPEGQAPDPAGVAVTVLESGQTRPFPTRTIFGAGYVLVVLPADTYDIRVSRPGRAPTVLRAVEVPADRTRMKVIGKGEN